MVLVGFPFSLAIERFVEFFVGCIREIFYSSSSTFCFFWILFTHMSSPEVRCKKRPSKKKIFRIHKSKFLMSQSLVCLICSMLVWNVCIGFLVDFVYTCERLLFLLVSCSQQSLCHSITMPNTTHHTKQQQEIRWRGRNVVDSIVLDTTDRREQRTAYTILPL